MFGILVLLFTIVPALEIYLLIQIGGAIGGFNTILLVILTGIVGAALAKSQGLSIINRIQQQTAQGQIPTDQFIHGLLVFGGGLLLLTPGILTDALGLSMVIPGSRFFWIHLAKQWFNNAIKNGSVHVQTFHYEERQSPLQQDNTIDSDTIEAEFHKKD